MMGPREVKRAVLLVACLFCLIPTSVFADDLLPVEDVEISKQFYGEETITLLDEGQWNPVVQFVSSPELEHRFVLRFDLSAYSGSQVGDARLSFFVDSANDFDQVSLDVWYLESDGEITVDAFDGGDIYVGAISYDTEPAGLHSIQERVELDVTELINSRNGDQVCFNVRLSGGYPSYAPNVLGSSESHHYVTLRASEYGLDYGPKLTIEGPYVVVGGDRKVYDTVVLDGTQSYDTMGSIVAFKWFLKCRGNPLYNRTADGATATVNNLRAGFYDVYLTVENDAGQEATGGFALLSMPQEAGDMDGDGDIDGNDVAAFAGKFGEVAP